MSLLLTTADVTVVIQTVGRLSLLRAVRSVLAQTVLAQDGTRDHGKGALGMPGDAKRIDIWIGVDMDRFGNMPCLRKEISVLVEKVPGAAVHWLDVGYSTSRRGPGVHNNLFGGALRTALSFLAKSELVAYLDDDDWWHPSHLELMLQVIEGRPWAFSLCWYCDGQTEKALGIDELESTGPGRGLYNETQGGFVRPSALMLNKLKLMPLLHLWSISPMKGGGGQDRLIFSKLKQVSEWGETRVPTVYYSLDPEDTAHRDRVVFLESTGSKVSVTRRRDSMRKEVEQDAARLRVERAGMTAANSPGKHTTAISPRKKLLVVLQEYPQISETYIKNELEALAETHELEILATLAASAPYRNRFPCLWLTRENQQNTIAYLRRWGPQAIHAHYLKMLPVAETISRIFNIPYTVRAHSFDVLDGAFLRIPRELFQSPRLKAVLCFPPFVENLRRAGIPAEKVVISNPLIDVPRFFTGTRSPGTGVMNVGAALPKKNMEEYIELSMLMPEHTFRLYGLGYQTRKLKALNDARGGRVEFVAPVEPEFMPAEYLRHEWLVYTASQENASVGWPMAIVEAQASGLGVAMQNIRGDLRDYCGPGAVLFDRVQDLVNIIDRPPRDEQLAAGFENSRRFDFRVQLARLADFWDEPESPARDGNPAAR